MRRREVIAVLAGAAAARPLDVMAQQERVRRIGVLMGSRENHPEAQARFAAIREGLPRNARLSITPFAQRGNLAGQPFLCGRASGRLPAFTASGAAW